MSFPASLDNFSHQANEPGAVDPPPDNTWAVASVVNAWVDGLNALESKAGIDGSSVPTTLDYKLKNAASYDPGHRHSALYPANGGGSTAAVAAVGSNDTLTVTQPNAGQVGLVVNNSSAAPTADLAAFQVTGTTLARVDPNGNLRAAGVGTQTSAAATALSNGSTIPISAGTSVYRVSSAANVTGIILGAGLFDGQQITVAQEAAFTVSFAALATSRVANGTSCAILASASLAFVWVAAANGGSGWWSPQMPLVNSNPGATNWNLNLASNTALAANTNTTLLTEAAPAAGTYAIAGYATFASGTQGNAELYLEVGGVVVASAETQDYASVQGFSVALSYVGALNGSQAVTLVARCAAAITVLAQTSNGGTNTATALSGFRIN